MDLHHSLSLEQNFAARSRHREVPLGWDWLVERSALFFTPRPGTRQLMRLAGEVLEREPAFAAMSDKRLFDTLGRLRAVIRLRRESQAETLDALAAIREISYRIRGQKPYATQIAGALGILRRSIVEMATGEGKTLTACLAAILCGWRGSGCHVVTSNDYLAERDADSMRDLYEACGVSVGSVTQDSKPDERKQAYARDVTYLTSKEAAADFLRDQMALGEVTSYAKALARSLAGGANLNLVQRGLASAIVDEADSVLCDGGSTPLIISVPSENSPSVEHYLLASDLADKLELGRDFLLNHAFREARLTDMGKKAVVLALRDWNGRRNGGKTLDKNRGFELVLQAIEARRFFAESVQYVVRDGKVIIVDEATGRIMPDHEWRDGLHQAVAAKEGLEVVPPRATNAQTSFQDFFLRYRSLGGMTGTAWEAKREFLQFYRLFVVRIPTHRPRRRYESFWAVLPDLESKIACIVQNVLEQHVQGRPVLVGTRSIEASEQVSEALTRAGVPHEVLNALQHEREAEIVAEAGRDYAVTVATNMAGRGTDIVLPPRVARQGGLHVILTEMHESIRVDRQLRGRCGRQGDPGTTADIICLDDILLHTAPRPLLSLLRVLMRRRRFKAAARRAGRLLARVCQYFKDKIAFRQRKQLVRSSRHFADLLSYSGKDDVTF